MSEIDLQQFCETDAGYRLYLRKPFSQSGATWATNGHIAVRVPLRPDAPEQDKPGCAQLASAIDNFEGAFLPMSLFTIPAFEPKTIKADCTECEGSGREHDCPSCTCVCDKCGGKGFTEDKTVGSVSLFGQIFNIEYLRQISTLPSVEIASLPKTGMAVFRFDGGDGLLMARRTVAETHFDLDKQEAAQ